MRNCIQITELTSQKMDASLPILAGLELKMHLMMCHTCRRYAKQISAMQQLLSVMEESVHAQKLSVTAKQRIATNLHEANTGRNQ